MPKKRSIFLIFTLLILLPIIDDSYAHSMFNSAEKFHAGYRVQVATAPEFPQIGEPSQFLIKVTDANFEEVDKFTMGMKFFFHDRQVDTIPPTLVQGGHWDFDYTWRTQGNHIVEVYLYDMEDNSDVITYKFNMGTQSPFGYIFIISIMIGALIFAVLMGYIYVPKLLKKSKL